MVALYLDDQKTPEQALAEFNRLVYKEQIIQEARKRMYYTPPSVKKREKRERARRLRRLLAKKYTRQLGETVMLKKAREKDVIEKRITQIKKSFGFLYKKAKGEQAK